MRSLPGRFHDGRNATTHAVQVTPTNTGLEIRGPDGLLIAFWHMADLRADGNLPKGQGIRLRCTAEGDARLTMEQAEFVRPLLPVHPGRSWRRPVMVVAAVILLAVGLWQGLPAAARYLAAWIPAPWEQRWGDAVADGFAQSLGRCTQPAGEAALDLLIGRLSAGLPPAERPRRILVVPSSDINAFALPGGTILVFSGLLADLKNPDELAGVLAHEVTHLRLHHPTAAMIRASGVGLVVTLVTGDASGLVASGAAMALAGTYSRDDEMAADAGAQQLLAQAGLDGHGLADFLSRLGSTGLPRWLDSHPAPAARVETLKRGPMPMGDTALSSEQWNAVKGMCGGPHRAPRKGSDI